jgi:malonyl-CoA O-methyltransferase
MTVLGVREGYRLWAPTYADETAVSHLDACLAAEMSPPTAGKRLLDAGCGAGRRLRGSGASMAVGVDISPEMLAAAADGAADPSTSFMVGDVRDLPLPDHGFDIVWCRLVAGHLPDCGPLYAELARVTDEGGFVLVTDFHPEAWAAGHRRTFRAGGEVHELEHHVHEVEDHLRAARAAGLELAALRQARIGEEVRGFYERAGRSELYHRHVGLAVVLALAFRRGS